MDGNVVLGIMTVGLCCSLDTFENNHFTIERSAASNMSVICVIW